MNRLLSLHFAGLSDSLRFDVQTPGALIPLKGRGFGGRNARDGLQIVTNKLPKPLKINESVLKKMEVGLSCAKLTPAVRFLLL